MANSYGFVLSAGMLIPSLIFFKRQSGHGASFSHRVDLSGMS
jgi:hypothetical protein